MPEPIIKTTVDWNSLPAEPITLSDKQASFTVDEIITILDAQIASWIDDPKLTIELARLAGEVLTRIPSWAPRIVEQFAGAKAGLDRYLNRPMTRQIVAELNDYLLTYGHFSDDIWVQADGSQHSVQIGPMYVDGMDSSELRVLIPIHFTLLDEEAPEVSHDGER